MALRFEVHSHTHYSNIRLIDSINKPETLIKRALELGLMGIAITDHECLSAHPEVNILAQQLLEKNPNFKVALGNEIYLCPTRGAGQKYYHFILIAKNKKGHKALRELSSNAWLNSFSDRGMERCVTTYEDIQNIVKKYPDSLIATTACLGGELSTQTLALINAEKVGDTNGIAEAHNDIISFILLCKEWFGNDFYIECAPGQSREQIAVNKRLVSIASAFNVKIVIGTDAHFLKAEDRFIHKAFLNSKDGDREVDAFYEYSYLQSEEEIIKNLTPSIVGLYNEMCNNSMEIWNKIENYSLLHKQQIPKVEVKDYDRGYNKDVKVKEQYPVLYSMFQSEDKVERYWVNECVNKLQEFGKYSEEYLSRLEEEARVKRIIGEKLETNMFAYPVTLQHYCDLFWECGSIVGAGRGSSCSGLNHYLLGITQLDPIQWNLPFWRYLNEERTELGDIDLDLCPSKRPLILQKIKEERGKKFIDSVSNITRQNCGCTLIATFGTVATKNAILTACRGYRSAECPDGIDVDTANYISSLIPSERGFLWPLADVVNGNEEKNRKPIATFIKEVEGYPGLMDVMFGIEGLIDKRSSHASGVILFDEDPYEFGCFMKTPSGEIITQYDLHMDEACGMTKYDFLVTEVQDKLATAIELLQEYNEIERDLSLKEVYNKYFHPSILPIEEDKYWKVLQNNSVINIFQFDSPVGGQAAKKIKPSSILEMADANGLMRLMTAEKGEETPMDKYVRFKNNINDWYKEMKEYGLTNEEIEVVKPYFLKSHGVPPSQEQMMMMLMDKNICNFTLAEANTARKIVGKKQMSKIPALRDKVLNQAKSPCLGHYIWKCGIGPQMGYSFSIIHALAYSFIGFQTMYIATRWNPIYWNCACLIVNSATLEEEEEEIVSIYEEEDDDEEYEDLPDRSGKKKKNKSADYAKTAKALGEIINNGIKVSLIDINKSGYSFKPDIENNQILFALKALSGVNAECIDMIIKNRPYSSLKDFMQKCPLNKKAMISLIKSGAFDNLEKEFYSNIEPRIAAMVYYLSRESSPKTKLTLQNFNGLIEKNMIPQELDFVKRVYNFNKYLKSHKIGEYYLFKDLEPCMRFYSEFFDTELLCMSDDGAVAILQKSWDKIYKIEMEACRDWLNSPATIAKYNFLLFKELWDKYAKGTISSWEMESLCFYYHEHELKNIDEEKYGISDFFDMPEEPEIDKMFKRNGHDIPLFKLRKIVGTIIAKNDTKSTVFILTTKGVVNVKFSKEYYAMYKRRISQTQENGKKKIIEEGWFKRGTKILLTGFRREDTFVTKSYSNTPTHQLYKITEIYDDGSIELTHDRKDANE